jgi:hypothetical protein
METLNPGTTQTAEHVLQILTRRYGPESLDLILDGMLNAAVHHCKADEIDNPYFEGEDLPTSPEHDLYQLGAQTTENWERAMSRVGHQPY